MRILNLGILAHVDAGKTSLTERLLYATGVIDHVGSVDDGNTQTDTLALERQRGITIKAAVASFAIHDVTVNLIDTPGHPDFIAEVERVLCVLDGAVLVISAVEGVQAQTRVLMRTLQRLCIPTLVFVNKIDRAGADIERVLQEIGQKLTPAIVAMGAVQELGTRGADFRSFDASDSDFMAQLGELLAEKNDAILAAYIDDRAALTYETMRSELAIQSRQALVHAVFFGSAITGAGVDALMHAMTELLPCLEGNAAGPLAATVFKVERGTAGEKIAYVRVFSGMIHIRDQLYMRDDSKRRVTAISVFENGIAQRREYVSAGQIAKLWGLEDIQIGDTLGLAQSNAQQHYFAPPSLETGIIPQRPSEKRALYAALKQLAEQDPLINLRLDDTRQELFVSLYGEVQKEVIQATLASDFNLEIGFSETTTICIERPIGSGAAFELIWKEANPFQATVGLRIDPAPFNTGVAFRLEVELGSILLSFHKAVEETVKATLQQGLYGWQVTDCIVTMTHSGYSSVTSTAGDFRNLTPLVLMEALKQADTLVYEPIQHFQLELPIDTFQTILPVLVQLRAIPQTQYMRGAAYILEGHIPAARVHELQQQLRGLTRGEGVLECGFDHYQAVSEPFPTRARMDHNPLNRKEYLLHVVRRV